MCNFFSGVVVRVTGGVRVYTSPDSDSHAVILRDHNLNDRSNFAADQIVKVEYEPDGDLWDFGSYKLHVDDDNSEPVWWEEFEGTIEKEMARQLQMYRVIKDSVRERGNIGHPNAGEDSGYVASYIVLPDVDHRRLNEPFGIVDGVLSGARVVMAPGSHLYVRHQYAGSEIHTKGEGTQVKIVQCDGYLAASGKVLAEVGVATRHARVYAEWEARVNINTDIAGSQVEGYNRGYVTSKNHVRLDYAAIPEPVEPVENVQ